MNDLTANELVFIMNLVRNDISKRKAASHVVDGRQALMSKLTSLHLAAVSKLEI